jgi:hypothetical protein
MKKRFNMKKKLRFLTLALAMAIVTLLTIAMPAMADTPVSHTITLLSGDTTEAAGYSTSNTTADPLNPALYSAGTWYDAPVIIDQPGVWVQSPPAQWVSSTANYSGTEGGNTLDSWRLFQDQFTIPSGATIISANVNVIAADNAFELYLNGNLIDSTATWDPVATVYGVSPVPDESQVPFRAFTTYHITPQAGVVNTLTFVVRNWDNLGYPNPTGLLYSASITYETSSVPPGVVGGTVYPVDKMQLLMPWLGVGLGAMILFSFTINRLFFRKRQIIRDR